jgi:7-cyano-7-deazaguanine reductase
MEDFWLPRSGPMPKPESPRQARQVLAREAFPAPQISRVSLETGEFPSIGPRSGQKCFESKSIKFYLWAYQGEPAFGEERAARIPDDIVFAMPQAGSRWCWSKTRGAASGPRPAVLAGAA